MTRIACLAAAVLAAAVAVPAHADPDGVPALTITSRHMSTRKQKLVVASGKVARTPAGIALTLRGSGALCNATWTLSGDVLHAELDVDAPALPSCTIVLAVAPWLDDHGTIGVQVDDGPVRSFTVPKA